VALQPDLFYKSGPFYISWNSYRIRYLFIS
jgi:hypothetical protein